MYIDMVYILLYLVARVSFVLYSPVYDFTSQYVVSVDDFFLHHLQKVQNICSDIHMINLRL